MFACSVSSAAASPATADFSISLLASIASHSHQVTGLAPAYGWSLFPRCRHRAKCPGNMFSKPLVVPPLHVSACCHGPGGLASWRRARQVRQGRAAAEGNQYESCGSPSSTASLAAARGQPLCAHRRGWSSLPHLARAGWGWVCDIRSGAS